MAAIHAPIKASGSSASLGPDSPPLRRSTSGLGEEAYEKARADLATAISGTRNLLTSLHEEQSRWTMHYPHELGVSHERAASVGPSRAELKRAASIPSEEPAHDEAKRPALPQRSATTLQTEQVDQPSKHPLSILSIDLRGSNQIVPSLSQATLAQFLTRRFESATRHLDQLHARVQDTSSRILVTGDLNAGKSTFVNALLRRQLMPTDQQPCTNVFCEVLDAAKLNGSIEEVHAVRHADLERYAVDVKDSFQRFTLKELEEVCMDGAEEFGLLKVYVNDACDSDKAEGLQGVNSFVNNGSVNIALIDAPGLNRDTLSTTALFARQSEIDIVVFVVSAENHFTLSAKEFLWNASREKAYVFVVVNKWAAIRDKARCERIVGQQIQQLSPGTWESRSELVHFVEAAAESGAEGNEGFEGLEASLRDFVLLKRAKSKLAPARHYVLNLLTDLGLLSDANLAAAEQQYREAEERLEVVRPIHERMLQQREEVSDGIAAVEDTRVSEVRGHAKITLERVIATLDQRDDALPKLSAWTELWAWAAELKSALLAKVEAAVVEEEEHARASAVDGVAEIKEGLGKKYLPDEQRQKDERVFRPEAMYSRRRKAQLKRPSSSSIGLNAGADVEISVLDLVDFSKFLPVQGGHKAIRHAVEEETATTLSAISVGVGAVTMFGSRAVGIKSFIETVSRVADVLGSPRARKLAGPIIAVLTGLLAWHIISDLPNALPRNIARKLQAALAAPPGAETDDAAYSTQQADRVARELRKVLRLAGYDLSERFRAGLEHCEMERNEIETSKREAEDSKRFFLRFTAQVDEQDSQVRAVELGTRTEAS